MSLCRVKVRYWYNASWNLFQSTNGGVDYLKYRGTYLLNETSSSWNIEALIFRAVDMAFFTQIWAQLTGNNSLLTSTNANPNDLGWLRKCIFKISRNTKFGWNYFEFRENAILNFREIPIKMSRNFRENTKTKIFAATLYWTLGYTAGVTFRKAWNILTLFHSKLGTYFHT